MTKRAWVVLPDLLSIRVFFGTGIATGLNERLGRRLAAVFLVPRDAAAEWLDRVPGLDVLHGDDLTTGDGLPDRALGRIDATLDRQLGYHPLAIRLNRRHGFHTERMQPGVVYTTFHFPESGANVITTEHSDWATNCPEYKVTAVQVMRVSQPSDWQTRYRAFSDRQKELLDKANEPVAPA